MTYNYKQKKIVAVIDSGIEQWQALNVLGHMSVSLGANKDEDLMGRNILIDASNIEHKGIARFGFIIKKGNSEQINELVNEVRNLSDITLIDFPQEMLDTRHDDELNESMKSKETKDFKYLGCLLYGPTGEVDELTKEYKLWS
jgi:hypothetical protein